MIFSIVRGWINYNFWWDRKRAKPESSSQIDGLKYFSLLLLQQQFFFPYTFTTILQLKILVPKILQKEETVITESKFSKETILGFPYSLKKKKKVK